nr:hypothetical protein [Desulfobaculum xiamenense]
MLARIDERVRAIAEDVAEIKCTRRCHTHAEKLRNLERVVFGLMAALAGLVGRAVFEMLH